MQEQKPGGASSSDMLKDLAAYLTLEKAQVRTHFNNHWSPLGAVVEGRRKWATACVSSCLSWMVQLLVVACEGAWGGRRKDMEATPSRLFCAVAPP